MASAARQQKLIAPIPPGRYWTDLNGRQIDDFDQWVQDMFGAVVVEKSEVQQRPVETTAGPQQRRFAFTIWSVPQGRAPFYPRHLGFPNFAPPEMQSRADAIADPAPHSWSEEFKNAGLPSAPSLGLGLGAIALLALYVVSR